MNVSFGWIFFLGGISGAIKVGRAVTLNEIGIGGDNGPKPMTARVRMALLALNLSLAIGGAISIQSNRNWNPFVPCIDCKIDYDIVP